MNIYYIMLRLDQLDRTESDECTDVKLNTDHNENRTIACVNF